MYKTPPLPLCISEISSATCVGVWCVYMMVFFNGRPSVSRTFAPTITSPSSTRRRHHDKQFRTHTRTNAARELINRFHHIINCGFANVLIIWIYTLVDSKLIHFRTSFNYAVKGICERCAQCQYRNYICPPVYHTKCWWCGTDLGESVRAHR